MNRTLISLLALCILLMPVALSYAKPLVPCDGPDCRLCDIVTLGQNIITWLIGVMATLCALVVAIAGLKMVTAGGNHGAVTEARNMMTNVVIGFIIILSAWLVVDTIMKMFLDEQVFGTRYGPWNEIKCVAEPTYTGGSVAQQQQGISSVLLVSPGAGVQCPVGNTACSVDALKNAGFTDKQANVMSCIAMTESSGIANTPPHNVKNPGSNSTACGTFQITRTTWNTAAKNISGCESFDSCMNALCNASVAKVLVDRSGYSDWTCQNCNAKAQTCIDKYSR